MLGEFWSIRNMVKLILFICCHRVRGCSMQLECTSALASHDAKDALKVRITGDGDRR